MRSIILSILTLAAVITTQTMTEAKHPTRPKVNVYHGYLIDKMCAPDMTVKGAGAYDEAANHTKTCLIEPKCIKGGFGMITSDNKWIPFNKAGSQKAEQLAVLTTKKDHVAIAVEGIMRGKTLSVSKITEE